jgi:hypothetical protein
MMTGIMFVVFTLQNYKGHVLRDFSAYREHGLIAMMATVGITCTRHPFTLIEAQKLISLEHRVDIWFE